MVAAIGTARKVVCGALAGQAQKAGKSADGKAGGRGRKKTLTAKNSKGKRAPTAKERGGGPDPWYNLYQGFSSRQWSRGLAN
jgi:hypothetical protein